MKFKTIVITKKSLLSAALITTGAGALAILFFLFNNISAEVFSMKAVTYEGILNESLPSYEEQGFNIKELAEKILRFDTNEPEKFIEEYSAAFERTTPDDLYISESNEELPVQAAKGFYTSAPTLPSHEEICSAAGLKINNATDFDIDINSICAEELNIKAADGEEPLVLVMHTHTTECYLGDEMNGETERTTDESLNVIAVGNEICSVLEENGIKTIHDTTYHDYPSYQGSYGRALSTIEGILKEYPSIQAVLDIHRDAFVYQDGSRLRVACDIDGISTAQVMLVVGTNSMGLWHDNWRENLKFAAKIQNAAEIMYPGLMRPVNLRTERFNGHTTNSSLILEVGSNGNTLEEAKEGGRDVARAIAAAILNG